MVTKINKNDQLKNSESMIGNPTSFIGEDNSE